MLVTFIFLIQPHSFNIQNIKYNFKKFVYHIKYKILWIVDSIGYHGYFSLNMQFVSKQNVLNFFKLIINIKL